MSSPATTSAPEQPVVRPSGPGSARSSGPATPWCPRPALRSARATSAGRSAGKQRRGSIDSSASEQGEVPVQLVLGDLGLIGVPLLSLVADEPLEDVIAQRVGQQLRALHLVDGVVQAGGQRLNSLLGQLFGCQGEQVLVGLRRQRVVLREFFL